MDKLTIILTLKDRSDFTLRWMKYMSDQRCPYKILIADGGADKLIEKKLNNSKNYPHLNPEENPESIKGASNAYENS